MTAPIQFPPALKHRVVKLQNQSYYDPDKNETFRDEGMEVLQAYDYNFSQDKLEKYRLSYENLIEDERRDDTSECVFGGARPLESVVDTSQMKIPGLMAEYHRHGKVIGYMLTKKVLPNYHRFGAEGHREGRILDAVVVEKCDDVEYDWKVLQPVVRCAIKEMDKNKISKLKQNQTSEDAEVEVQAYSFISLIPSYGSMGKECILKQLDVLEDELNLYSIHPMCSRDLFEELQERGIDSMRYREKDHLVQKYAKQLLEALCFLHNIAGIYHRDVSLENILLSENGGCLLMDFGMALRVPYKETVNGSKRRMPCDITVKKKVGKRYYVAPEIHQGSSTSLTYNGFSADMFSAGVCIYVLLTGEFPFSDNGDIYPSYERGIYSEIGSGHLENVLRRRGLNISDDAIKLLQNLLFREPHRRWTAARALESNWFNNLSTRNENGNDEPPTLQPWA